MQMPTQAQEIPFLDSSYPIYQQAQEIPFLDSSLPYSPASHLGISRLKVQKLARALGKFLVFKDVIAKKTNVS